ncbi:MAG: trypsin-like serine protease [Ruminococcus sp.]|nr:trypsin-like serine protease [Ruminococcus sp.]
MSDNFNEYENNQDSYNSCTYSSENNSDNKKKKGNKGLKAVALILCMAIVAGGSIQVYKFIDENNHKVSDFDEEETTEKATSAMESTKKTETNDLPDEDIPSLIELASREDAKPIPTIVEEVMPSVVGISSTFEYTPTINNGWNWGFGGGTSQGSAQTFVGTGTGIVMTDDGYIITNAHVVYDESEYQCGEAVEVSVLFTSNNDEEDYTEHDAKIIAYDRETDIAVLKVNETGLTPASFGNSEELRVGELVIAIGNPLGFDLFGSVTSGIVSALDREININEKNMNLIQTDAAINSGNSGGPLLNSCGQVIGINSAKMSSSYSSSASIEGLGFAIPIDEAKLIIDDLINYKYVRGRPQIGITTQDVSEVVSRYYNIPMGIYVVDVVEGSTAEFAGIKSGDVIIGIQGESVSTAEELNEIKNQYKAGEEITLTITRDGEDIEISLILQEKTSENIEPTEESQEDDNSDNR